MNTLSEKVRRNQPESSLSASYVLVLFGIGLFGSAGFLFAPFWVGGLVEQHAWTAANAGLLISAELAGAALGSLVIMLGQLKRFAKIGLVVLALANFATTAVLMVAPESHTVTIIIRAVAGLGGGVGLAATYIGLSATAKPDRYFGLFLAVTLFMSGVGFYLFPILMSAFEIGGIYAGWAVFNLILLGAFLIAPKPSGSTTRDQTAGAFSGVAAILLALFLLFSAQGAIWTFLERIAAETNISAQRFGLTLALSSLAGFIGGLINAVQSDRFGRKWPVVSAISASFFLIVLLTPPVHPVALAVSVCGLQLLWCYAIPFLMGGLAEKLADRRGMAAGVFVQLAGLGLGPFVVSALLGAGRDIASVVWVAIGFSCLTVVAALFTLSHKHSPLVEA